MSLASGLQPESEPVRSAPPSHEGEAVAPPPELSVNLSAQGISSGDLALDLILHDIAERALQLTGATGAAIGLERGRTMVCRAAAGTTAPDLGVQINVQSGLTGACVRERILQWCSDTEHDDRVDAEACRMLGVRSIIVVPLFVGTRIVGVLEIFSSQAAAFRDRDVRALQGTANWVTEAVGGGTNQKQVGPAGIAGDKPLNAFRTLAAQSYGGPRGSAKSIQESAQLLARRDRTTRVLRVVAITLGIVLAGLLGFRWARQDRPQASVVVTSATAGVNANEQSLDGLRSDLAPSKKPNPASDRRRGPANNAALILRDDTSRIPARSPAQAKSGLAESGGVKATDAPGKTRVQRVPEGTAAVNQEELAALASGSLRAVPTAMSPAVAPPVSAPPLTVSKGVAEGRLIRSVQPRYPKDALVRHIEGVVVLRAVIGKDGSMHQVQSVKGHPLLAQAAIEAVRQWKYQPYSLNGVPVDMPIDISINFNVPK